MPTGKQDSNFANEMKDTIEIIVSDNALENAIDWISKNLDPYEVFSTKQLTDWASGEEPESIFEASTLEQWAESNGYTKE